MAPVGNAVEFEFEVEVEVEEEDIGVGVVVTGIGDALVVVVVVVVGVLDDATSLDDFLWPAASNRNPMLPLPITRIELLLAEFGLVAVAAGEAPAP